MAPAEPVRLWIIGHELPLERAPSAEAIDAFCARYGSILDDGDSAEQLKRAPHRAQLVLAQEREMGVFLALQRECGIPLRLRMLYWTGAHGELMDLARQANPLHPPHIIHDPTTWHADLVEQGLLRPLGAGFEDLVRSLQAAGRGNLLTTCGAPDGVLHALPWHVDVRVLYVRKAAWPSGVPALSTFEAFRDACAGVQPQVAGPQTKFIRALGLDRVRDWNQLHTFAAWLHAMGGRVVDPASRAVLPAEGLMTTLEYLTNLVPHTQAFVGDLRRLEKFFLNEEVALIVTGPWFVADLLERMGPDWPAHVEVRLLPSASGRAEDSRTFLGGAHLALTRFARHPDAERLLRFLVGDGMRRQVDSLGHVPAFPDPFEHYFRSRYPACASAIDMAIRTGVAYPSLPRWSHMENDVGNDAFFQLWGGILDGVPPGQLASRLASWRHRMAAVLWPVPWPRILVLVVLGLILLGGLAFAAERLWVIRKLAALRRQLARLQAEQARDEEFLRRLREKDRPSSSEGGSHGRP
ncbi:MAG: extracellular solute-binding protein [Kiritimatiellae bacterium]|nr:extracellular solute-binding protein [Kiritimatiellia bacterium]